MSLFKTIFFGKNLTNHRNHQTPVKKQLLTIQAIWNNYHYKDAGLEKLVRVLLAISQLFFPGIYIRQFFWRFGNLAEDFSTDVYVLLKFFVPAMVLYFSTAHETIAMVLCVVFLVETIAYVSSLVFASDMFSRPRSYRRAMLLLFFNYLEIVFTFAVLYSSGDNVSPAFGGALDAIYFSFSTSATIGFGDFVPATKMAKVLVIFQSVVYLMFLVIFVNVFANKIEQRGYFGKGSDQDQE